MADPKNPGYALTLLATDDPDVVRVVESDDLLGPAPARNVSAVEAGRLWAATAPPSLKPAKKAAPVKKAARKK